MILNFMVVLRHKKAKIDFKNRLNNLLVAKFILSK